MRLAVAVIAAGLFAAGSAAAQVTQSYSEWWLACDNAKTCAAFGFDETGGAGGYAKISREAGPNAAATVEAVFYDDANPEGVRGALSLSVDGEGGDLLSLTVTAEADGSYLHARVPPGETARMISALRKGAALSVGKGEARTVIPLAGVSAALLKMDDLQGRVDTVTALVRPGAKPASAVPAAPALPVIRRAAAVSQAKLPSALPAALKANAQVKSCAEDDNPALELQPASWRLKPGMLLWSIPCGAGAYNFSSLWLVTDEAGGDAKPAPFQNYPGAYANAENEALLINAEYAPETRTLNAFSKGRGLGDCGSDETWVWDGAALRQSEAVVMGECQGVSPSDWPTVWRAQVQ